MQTEISQQHTSIFNEMGKPFQEKVFRAIVTDRQWALSLREVFELDKSFDLPHLRLMTEKVFGYYDRFKAFPSTDVIRGMVDDVLTKEIDAPIKRQCHISLRQVEDGIDAGDLPWIKEKAFSFCRQQRLKNALAKCIDIIKTDSYESVVPILKDAVYAGTTSTTGHDYLNDFEARYAVESRNAIPTSIPELDDPEYLDGGLGSGEIGIIVAPTGVGKSHLLTFFGGAALKHGKTVFHYTLELNERYTGIRYDSNLLQLPSLSCKANPQAVKEFFADPERSGRLGKLYIKQYPARKITAGTISAHVEAMAVKGIRPDLIIVDYAGLVRSSDRYDLQRLEMQMVVQELRALATELNIPIWTALQSNKEGAKNEIVDVTNMAESYGQAGEADVVLGLQRLSEQKSTGYGTLFLAKNRAGKDGVKFDIHLDTATSTIRVISPDERKGSMEDVYENLKGKASGQTFDAFMNDFKNSKFSKGIEPGLSVQR